MDNGSVNDKNIEMLFDKLDALDRKLSNFIEGFIETRTKLGVAEERIKDFEARVRGLEGSDRKWAVVAVLISGVITVLVTGIGAFLTALISRVFGA
jgi:hypothetical protein